MSIEYKSKTSPRYEIPCKYCLPSPGDLPLKGLILGIHGFSGSKESTGLQVLAKCVVPEGYGLVCFDLPAHWKSPAPPEMLTAENAMQDILFMAEECRKEFPGIPKFIFATSFGAWLTLLCCKETFSGRGSQDPDKGCHPADFSHGGAKNQAFGGKTVKGEARSSGRTSLEGFRIILRAPAVTMPEIFLRLLGMTAEEFKEKTPCECSPDPARPLLLPYSFYESLSRHSVFDAPAKAYPPMLVMHGDADTVVPPADVRRFCSQYPQMELHMIPGCGHDFTAPGALEEMCRLTLACLEKDVL